MILALRSDKHEAEIYLYSKQKEKLQELKWQAHRNLSKDIHIKIKEILASQHIDYPDLSGLILYKGPGSFTGLRIGASVANVLASELNVPVVGADGKDWLDVGLEWLQKNPTDRLVIPEYGAQPNTTKPKK